MPPKKNNKPSGNKPSAFVTRAGRKTKPNRIIWSQSQQETMIENEQQPSMVQIVQQQEMIENEQQPSMVQIVQQQVMIENEQQPSMVQIVQQKVMIQFYIIFYNIIIIIILIYWIPFNRLQIFRKSI